MGEAVEFWIARDKNGILEGYFNDAPIKYKDEDLWDNENAHFRLPINLFPNIKWEDKEPTKAKIDIIK